MNGDARPLDGLQHRRVSVCYSAVQCRCGVALPTSELIGQMMSMEGVLAEPSLWTSEKINLQESDFESWLPPPVIQSDVVVMTPARAYLDDTCRSVLANESPGQVNRTSRLQEECNKDLCGPHGEVRELCEKRQFQDVLCVLHRMDRQDIGIHPDVFIRLLRECINMNSITSGKQVHAFILRSGSESNTFIGNNLVNMYVKCGSLQDAWHVFQKMPERNVISWTALVEGFTLHGYAMDAIKLFQQMEEEGVEPNEVTFACALKACVCLVALDQGMQIHLHIIRRGLDADSFLGNTLIDMYAKCGSIQHAHQVFEKLHKKDIVAWTAIISGYVLHGQSEEALRLFGQMQCKEVKPNELTFVSVLNACALLGALEVGKQIHKHVNECKFESNVFIGSSLVDMYAKCGSIDHARKVFDQMPERNVVSWTAMIAGYVKQEQSEQAIKLFWQMQKDGVKPTAVTFVSVVKACAHPTALEDGKSIHAQIIKRAYDLEVSVGNSLIEMYLKCQNIERACQVFDKMPIRDIISFTMMITGYVQYGPSQRAIKLFWRMQREGVKPDEIIITSALNACAALSALEQGKSIHARGIENGLESDTVLKSTLINMYMKCGSVEHALQAFNKIATQDAVSWTAMIAGHVQHGHGGEALSLFWQMQREGITPNAVTFVSTLNACVLMAGLEQGQQTHADIIESGIESDVFVASALVDMYAKCGSVEKAQVIFERVPERGVVLWNAMIAGYSHHGNAKVALELAERMQKEGAIMDRITFISVLSACSHAGLVKEGRFYFNLMRQHHKILPMAEHYACMVDLLGRAGHLEEAEDFARKSLFQRSAVVWMALLAACKIHGNVELANIAKNQVLKLDPGNSAAPVLISNLCAAACR